MVEWAGEYIGIPYRLKGRDRNGCDCWGLVCLVYKERFKIDLDKFMYDSLDDGVLKISEHKNAFTKVNNPSIGDIILFNFFGKPTHIGIIVGNAEERNLLHTLKNHDSVLDTYNGPRWANRIEGVYRVL